MSALKPSDFNEAVYVGLGSNLGNPEENLARAIAFLKEQSALRVLKCAAYRETLPWGVEEQPPFLNSAVLLNTGLSPADLLQLLKRGEKQLGRPQGLKWGPRVIDMDILLFGTRICSTADLKVPHLELKNRAFALEPLIELNADLVHPVCGTLLKQMLAELQR